MLHWGQVSFRVVGVCPAKNISQKPGLNTVWQWGQMYSTFLWMTDTMTRAAGTDAARVARYGHQRPRSNPTMKALYLDAEHEDGYIRDKCVFSDEIDIEDSVALNIKYSGGTVVSYSFTAHSPYEGPKFVFNGTKGRMEATSVYSITDGKGKNEIKIYDRFSDVITYEFDARGIITETNLGAGASRDVLYGGGHGGSDHIMRQMLIRGGFEDKLGQVADIKSAAMSIGIGIAANKSMLEDRAVYISELFDL